MHGVNICDAAGLEEQGKRIAKDCLRKGMTPEDINAALMRVIDSVATLDVNAPG